MTTRVVEDAAGSEESAPPPRIASRYEVLGLIGMGGMGSVYRVRDVELDEIVALKFLRREVSDEKTQDRFRDEARLARRVSHPNVARTFDIGDHDGEKFITMEFVDGEPLSRILEREGALAVRRAGDVVRQICAGLDAAHAAGVVHRDLKPDNVLVERTGRVAIGDFGIARGGGARSADTRGGIIGTAAYMSPEQAAAAPVDARSDVYALGTVLYEVLTGVRAWTGEGYVQVAARRLYEPPPDPRALRPDLPAAICDVVLRCLATRREDRFADAASVAAAFEAALSGADAVVATPPREAMPLAARAFRVAPAPQAGGTTVAVLPFENQGPPEDAFLADEVTDELIDTLSMTGGLRVRPRRLVARHDTSDLRAFGEALGVDVVVEGKIRRAADTVRIGARAIAIAEDLQIWARRFERPTHDLAAVNRELAAAVGEAIAGREAPLAATAVDRAPIAGGDPIAAELYLRARSELRRGWGGMTDLSLAVELFRQCVARTPTDPAAISGYAMARARRYNYVGGDAAELEAIRGLAARAIALAPHLGEPWQTQATLGFVTGAWPDAVRAFRRALHLAPGLLKAHETLGHIEIEVGRVDEGLFRLETVMSLDPTLTNARWEAVRAHGMRGEWDRVDALLALPVEDGPATWMRRFSMARLDLWRGEARHPAIEPSEADREQLLIANAMAIVVRGGALPSDFEPRLRARLAATPGGSRLRPLLWQFYAELSAGVGRDDVALEAVRGSVASGLNDRAWLTACPLLARLRADPGWADVVAPVLARTIPVVEALDEPFEPSP